MRSLALVLLTAAMASLIAMAICFFLALFGDLFGPAIAERHWSRLALPFGMATLFFFGIGGALLREASARDELARAIDIMRREVGRALDEAEDARDVLNRAIPAVDRFRRAVAQAPGLAPKEWVDLSDLVIFAESNPAEACGYLQDLYAALEKGPRAAAKPQPAASKEKAKKG